MDWPAAGVIIASIVPVTVALIKFIPGRISIRESTKDLLRNSDFAVLKRDVESLAKEIHDMKKKVDALADMVSKHYRVRGEN